MRRDAAHPLREQRLVDGDEQDVAVVEDEQARRQHQRHAPSARDQMMEGGRGGQLGFGVGHDSPGRHSITKPPSLVEGTDQVIGARRAAAPAGELVRRAGASSRPFHASLTWHLACSLHRPGDAYEPRRDTLMPSYARTHPRADATDDQLLAGGGARGSRTLWTRRRPARRRLPTPARRPQPGSGEAAPDRRAQRPQRGHATAGRGAADGRDTDAGAAVDQQLQRADHQGHGWRASYAKVDATLDALLDATAPEPAAGTTGRGRHERHVADRRTPSIQRSAPSSRSSARISTSSKMWRVVAKTWRARRGERHRSAATAARLSAARRARDTGLDRRAGGHRRPGGRTARADGRRARRSGCLRRRA